MRKKYAKVKMQIRLAQRDGWKCHYCHTPLCHSTDWNSVRWYIHADETYKITLYGSAEEQRIYQGMQSRTLQPAQVDHKIPVALGGTNDFDNLVLACSQCNLYKKHTVSYRMMRWLFGGVRFSTR